MRTEPETVAFRLTNDDKECLRHIAERYPVIGGLSALMAVIVLGDRRERGKHTFGPGTFVTFKARGVQRIGCVVALYRTMADVRYQTLADERAWARDGFGVHVPSRVTRRHLNELEQWSGPAPSWWTVHEMRRR